MADDKTSNAPEEKVVLTQEEVNAFKKMIAEGAAKDEKIANLEGLVGALRKSVDEKGLTPESPVVDNDKICRMRKWQDKWVLGWVKNPKHAKEGAYREMDPISREWIDYLDIIVDGEKEPVKVRLLDFLNNCPQIVVAIKERNKLPDEVTEGEVVDKLVYNEKTGLLEPTGLRVKSRVVTERYQYVLDLDGKNVIVDEKFINA